jgi:hypothetical protein
MSDDWQGYLPLPLGIHITAISPDGEKVEGIVNRRTERRNFVTRVLVQQDGQPQRRLDFPPWKVTSVNGRPV